MPKTTGFLTSYGYTRHPDDKDNTCFWCGCAVNNTWDYTPSRDIAKVPELMAVCPEPPIAVSSCITCRNRMAYHKMALITIDKKRQFWKNSRPKSDEIANKKRELMLSTLEDFQTMWDDGTITYRDDLELDAEQQARKREHMALHSPKTEDRPFNPHTDLADFS